MITYSITKTISINAPVRKVFEFLADLGNWRQWAILSITSIEVYDDEWWEASTPAGSTLLRLRSNTLFGTLDLDVDVSDLSSTVSGRVVPSGTGAEFMMTFMQPRGTSREVFERQVTSFGDELRQLKNLLEANEISARIASVAANRAPPG